MARLDDQAASLGLGLRHGPSIRHTGRFEVVPQRLNDFNVGEIEGFLRAPHGIASVAEVGSGFVGSTVGVITLRVPAWIFE